MSEQQRVLIAMALCVAIFAGWQLFFRPTEPEVPPAEPTAAAPQATSPAAAPQAIAPTPSADGQAPAAELPEQIVRVESPLLSAELSSRTLAFRKLVLPGFQQRPTKEQPNPGPVDLALAKVAGEPYQAGVRWQLGGQPAPPMAVVEQSRDRARLASQGGPVRTEMQLLARADVHAVDLGLAVTNGGTAPLEAGAELELRIDVPERKGGMFSGPGIESHAMCFMDGSVVRKTLSNVDEGETYAGAGETEWAAIDRQYFVIAAQTVGPGRRCTVSAEGRDLVLRYSLGAQTLAPGETLRRDVVLYAGPKRGEELEKIGATLSALIDYNIWGIPLGFIARPMIYLLHVFHDWVGSWGIAIMLLTLMVKSVLFPVTYRSAVSMRRMQMLKPEMDGIKEKFKDDKERQQMEMLKLYKERGINPLQGCLPMLLQMPVWLSLYRALWTTVDLYQQRFLWLPDLTAAEPGIPFLALALGCVFFVQQLVTPMTADNQQAKIMKWVMPVMFTFFMFALPSGLVLYIFVNTVLSIIQQLAINKTVGPAMSTTTGVVAPLKRPGGPGKTVKSPKSRDSDNSDKAAKAAK